MSKTQLNDQTAPIIFYQQYSASGSRSSRGSCGLGDSSYEDRKLFCRMIWGALMLEVEGGWSAKDYGVMMRERVLLIGQWDELQMCTHRAQECDYGVWLHCVVDQTYTCGGVHKF